MNTRLYSVISLAFIIVVLTGSQVCKAQWMPQNSGTNEQLNDVVMLDSSTAIAVGIGGSIYRTTDSGAKWEFVGVPWSYPMDWKSICFSDSKNGILVGGNNIITTNDGGQIWKMRYHSTDKNFLSAFCIGPSKFYVGDDSGYVYNSVDSGKTWTSEKISSYPIVDIFPWRGTFAVGLPVYALTTHSLFERFEFPPTSWSLVDTLQNLSWLGSQANAGEFCNGGGTGFIAGVQGDLRSAPLVLRKMFSDSLWRYNGLPFGNGPLYGVSAPSDEVIYVCGDDGLIGRSTDGGDTWNQAIFLFNSTVPTLRSIYFYNDEMGFAVGDNGTILFTKNGGIITGISGENTNIPEEFCLSQNYPNPFNPTTTIRYSIPTLLEANSLPTGQAGGRQFASTTKVELKIYDLLGKVVATLVDKQQNSGTYEVEFNASKLSSGIYFYSLHAGNFTKTLKLVLLK